MRSLAFVILIGLLGTMLIVGCGSKGGDGIVIGEYGSLSGSEATFGVSSQEGIELAAEEINAAGGALGKKIVLKVENDESLEDKVAAAVQKLINLHGAKVILGEVASGRSLVGGPVCENARIPMVTHASTNPAVTQGKKYVFRICWTDDFQGEAMAKFAFEALHAKKAGVLTAINQAYSKGLSDFFKKTFTSLGGQIVADESYQGGQKDKDFKAQLTNIKAKNPDVLFIPGYYTDVGLIATQARQAGLSIPMLGGDGWDSEELLREAKDVIEGCYYSNHYAVDEDRPEIKTFVETYKAKYKKTPDAMAALGYDAMRIVADAIERAKSTNGDAIQKALAETKDFKGVTGKITIDENHNAQKPLVVLQIHDGTLKFVKSVAP